VAREICLRGVDPLQGLMKPATVHNASLAICYVDTTILNATMPV
jgi:hypothetical protein